MNTQQDDLRAVACIRFVRLCGVWLVFAALLILVQPIHGTLFCLWWIGERCGKLMNLTERIGTKWQNYRLAVNKANAFAETRER